MVAFISWGYDLQFPSHITVSRYFAKCGFIYKNISHHRRLPCKYFSCCISYAFPMYLVNKYVQDRFSPMYSSCISHVFLMYFWCIFHVLLMYFPCILLTNISLHRLSPMYFVCRPTIEKMFCHQQVSQIISKNDSYLKIWKDFREFWCVKNMFAQYQSKADKNKQTSEKIWEYIAFQRTEVLCQFSSSFQFLK